ncbi:MAG TPA: hypothetical protein VHE81_19840 [Lacipirellulaceae bacterium]|nr:hypothetical protein [Lacipirellulaceae bacterium]
MSESYLDHLTQAFEIAKARAIEEAERRNAKLERVCKCGETSFVAGLCCPSCGSQADRDHSWVVVRDTEFGYDLIPIGSRFDVLATFRVDM